MSKRKYIVGICGHFGKGKIYTDGQTIKTKMITSELENEFGEKNIYKVDTNSWGINPISFFCECIKLLRYCDHVIILPAQRGIKVFAPLFVIFNNIFKVKLYYIVIGGWLPELIKKYKILKIFLKHFDKIYVETTQVILQLNNMGINNTVQLKNFKDISIINEEQLLYYKNEPFKICTLSRVMEQKGIEDVIQVVKSINDKMGKDVYLLDIYGPIDEKYKEKFNEIIKNFPSSIKYKGIVDYKETSEVLKNYYILIFPTKFITEGIPGTIIDAYAAGVPVLASRWNSYNDIIEEGKTGFSYKFNNLEDMEKKLIFLMNNTDIVNNIKKHCLKKAIENNSKTVIKKLIDDIKEYD